MSKVQSCLQSRVGGNKSTIKNYTLSASDAAILKECAAADSISSSYLSRVSLVNAIQGIEAGFFLWPTVQLYYSVFYSIQAILLSDQIGMFRVRSAPKTLWKLDLRAGSHPTTVAGTTHGGCLNIFQQDYRSELLLSQEIDSASPVEWLKNRREEANYRTEDRYDPVCPDHFSNVARIGVRKLLAAYGQDRDNLYTFDPDHAMIAYPLRALELSLDKLRGSGSVLSEKVRDDYLRQRFRDKDGSLGGVAPFIVDV